MSPDPKRSLKLSLGLLVALTLSACATSSSSSSPKSFAVARVAGRTELILLGALHKAHLSSRAYSLALIERVLRQVDADVVLVEIPPDRFDGALAEVDRLGAAATADAIQDPWLSAFPELYRVVLPLRHALGYEVVPVSGWRPIVSQHRQRYWRKHPQGPDTVSYRDATARFQQARRDQRASENPCWVNGPEYRRLSAAAQQALAQSADAQLGEAAVLKINAAHWSFVKQAVQKHRGKRILLIYGALHRWYLEPRLRALPAVHWLDVRHWLGCAR